MKSAKRTRSGFNFLAPFYDGMSRLFFGKNILNSQTCFLQEETKHKNALIFGGGTGKLLIELMTHNLAENYCYVDISDKMIAKARKKVEKNFPGQLKNIHFVCGSYDVIPAEEKFEIIFTPYVLDCFTNEELPAVMKKLDQHLLQDGKWFFSDFNVPENKLKSFSFATIRTLYFFFNIVCGLGVKRLPDFKIQFSQLGYKEEKEKYFLKELLVTRVYKK